MAIGEKIKKYRKESGYTQVVLSEMAHISRTYLADVERGRYNPSVDTLTEIASALQIPVSYLIDDEIDEGLIDIESSTPSKQKKETLPTLEEAERIYRDVLIRTKMKEKGKTMKPEDRERMERVVEMGLRILRESSE